MSPMYMSATLSFSKPRPTEIDLTYAWIVLWDGDSYEVTIYEEEPVDHPTVALIERRSGFESMGHCEKYVRKILNRDILAAAQDMVQYEAN